MRPLFDGEQVTGSYKDALLHLSEQQDQHAHLLTRAQQPNEAQTSNKSFSK
jgi:hypothetical protein